MAGKRVAPTREALAMARSFLEGVSVRQIAEDWNLHPMTVEQTLRDALVFRPRASGARDGRKAR